MSKPKFLNVDLELRSRTGIPKLVAALGRGVFSLHDEQKDYAILEVTSHALTIDQTISAFYKAYRKLSPEGLRLWNKCSKRNFAIGIETGVYPRQQGNFSLSEKSLAKIVEMKGSIDLTIYDYDHSERSALRD